jgi:hypothetical protein
VADYNIELGGSLAKEGAGGGEVEESGGLSFRKIFPMDKIEICGTAYNVRLEIKRPERDGIDKHPTISMCPPQRPNCRLTYDPIAIFLRK